MPSRLAISSSGGFAGTTLVTTQEASPAPRKLVTSEVKSYQTSKDGNGNKPGWSLLAPELKLAVRVTERQAAQQAATIQNLQLQLATQQDKNEKQQCQQQIELLRLKLQIAQQHINSTEQQQVVSKQAEELKQLREQLAADDSKQQEVVRQQAEEIKRLREQLQQQNTQLSDAQQQAQRQCQELQQKVKQTKEVAFKLLRQWQDELKQKQALQQLLDDKTKDQELYSAATAQLLIGFADLMAKQDNAKPAHELQKTDGKTHPAAVVAPQPPGATAKLEGTPPQPAASASGGTLSKASGRLLQQVDSMDCPGTPSGVDSSSGCSNRSSCSGSDTGSNANCPGTPSKTGSRSACTCSTYSSSDTGTSCSSQPKNHSEHEASSWWWWGAQNAASTSSYSSNSSDSYGSMFSSWW